MATKLALATLLSGLEAEVWGPGEAEVSGLAYDSRRVVAGDAFIAVHGFVHDGVCFAGEALDRGAVAVIAEVGPDAAPANLADRAWVRVADAREALARLSCRFYGDPSRKLTVVGVTGTNGKTTVSALLESILAQQGPAGRWSTTAVRIAGDHYPAERTTPEALDLQRALHRMVERACWAAAIEVSSHALVLRRVAGTCFRAAVFTNLSNDHLDFHADLDDYLAAKARLFEMLPEDGVAVLNVGDPATVRIAEHSAAPVVAFGWEHSARRATSPTAGTDRARPGPASPGLDLEPAYRISSWIGNVDGSRMVLETPAGALELETPLFGPANAENIAAACAAALELGCPPGALSSGVSAFGGAPGRLQRVDVGQPFAVLVDYAHTPAALDAALITARSLARDHRVIAVFGCGGDRDRGKRPMMGRIAAELADHILVTSDNPRSEDPEAILDEIEAGISPAAGATIERQPDRRLAIERAVRLAAAGDCVLIAGKGHETEQVFRDRIVPFDDVDVARRCLSSSEVSTRSAPADELVTGRPSDLGSRR